MPPARLPGVTMATSSALAILKPRPDKHLVMSRRYFKEGGAGWDDVLKCNVYLKEVKDFQKMNDVFREIFPENPPARTTVQTPMAEESMLVEIEAVAYLGD